MDEEQKRLLQQRGAMVGAAQGPLMLGGGASVPAFPSNFSNINPQQQTNPIRFGGGGTATMGFGGANVEYPSRLTLSGGTYGPREMGASSFAPAALPQAQPQQMLRQMYDNPFATPAQRFGESLTRGLTQLPQTNRLPIDQGPLSMNIAAPQSAIAQGRQAIQTPRGTIYATQEQAANMMAPRTLAQQSSRSPAEQQALIAQMRTQGAALAQQRIQGQEQFFAQKQAERAALADATIEAYRRGASPQSVREARQAYTSQQPSSIAGIQRQFASMSGAGFNRPMAERTAFVTNPFNAVANAPQPATGGPSTMAVGGSPISFTPFAQRSNQQEVSPLSRFAAAIRPQAVDQRFRPLPFGMRQFGVA